MEVIGSDSSAVIETDSSAVIETGDDDQGVAANGNDV